MASCCFFGCRSLFTLMELLLNVSRICPWKVMLKLPRTYSPILLGMPCFEGMPCDKRRTTLIHLLLSVSKKGSSAKFLVRVNFAMKTPSSGFPTKAMFLPSYESSIVCQDSGEQTMAGSDEGKNGGFIVSLKRESKFCKLPPSDFLLEHFSKIHHKFCRRTQTRTIANCVN